MTVQLKTLDQALAASRDPIAPGDLAGRIVTEATAQSQHKPNGLLPRRRPRRERRNGRVRRPVILSSIGGGLIAISAVAAALAVDGRLDVSQLAKPVMGLFGAAPTEVVERPVPQSRPQTASAAPMAPEAEIVANAPLRAERQDRPLRRLGQRFRRIALARRLQQRRRAALADDGTTPPTLRRRWGRQLSAARRDAGIDNRPIHERAANRTISSATLRERRADRIRALREQSGNAASPVTNRRAARAAAIGDRLRERRSAHSAISAPAARPASLPTSDSPSATQNVASATPVSRPDLIAENVPPGPEPMALPDVSPQAAQSSQGEAAGGAQRPRARNAAEQRRALRRDRIQRRMRQSDRPRRLRDRPRIPRPRR
ncbi:MAG: hypothetical protein HKN78_13060 [Sphingomonadaceae bacterium]|nr:hypothetical protein [Sphingomonadaceae bacterium]